MVKIYPGPYSFGSDFEKPFYIPDGTVIKPNPNKFVVIWSLVDKQITKILKKHGGKVPKGKFIEVTSTKNHKDIAKLKALK